MHHLPPGLPDVQDRKRILGCLAGILAGMYSYDVHPHVVGPASATAAPTTATSGEAGGEAIGGGEAAAAAETEAKPRARLSRLDSRPVYSDLDDSNCDMDIGDEDEDGIAENEVGDEDGIGTVSVDMDRRRQGSDQAVVGAAPSVDDDSDDGGDEDEEDDDFHDDSFYGDDAVLTTSPSSRVCTRCPVVKRSTGILPVSGF